MGQLLKAARRRTSLNRPHSLPAPQPALVLSRCAWPRTSVPSIPFTRITFGKRWLHVKRFALTSAFCAPTQTKATKPKPLACRWPTVWRCCGAAAVATASFACTTAAAVHGTGKAGAFAIAHHQPPPPSPSPFSPTSPLPPPHPLSLDQKFSHPGNLRHAAASSRRPPDRAVPNHRPGLVSHALLSSRAFVFKEMFLRLFQVRKSHPSPPSNLGQSARPSSVPHRHATRGLQQLQRRHSSAACAP